VVFVKAIWFSFEWVTCFSINIYFIGFSEGIDYVFLGLRRL